MNPTAFRGISVYVRAHNMALISLEKNQILSSNLTYLTFGEIIC